MTANGTIYHQWFPKLDRPGMGSSHNMRVLNLLSILIKHWNDTKILNMGYFWTALCDGFVLEWVPDWLIEAKTGIRNHSISGWNGPNILMGARWLSGRVSDSGARGPGFETYRRRVVSLSKTLYSPKVLVNYPGSDGSVPTWLKNCWLGR